MTAPAPGWGTAGDERGTLAVMIAIFTVVMPVPSAGSTRTARAPPAS